MLSHAFSSCRRILVFACFMDDASTFAIEEERRSSGRFPCHIETTCQPAASTDKGRTAVRVRNISRGGIKIEASRRFQPGELLSYEQSDNDAELEKADAD